MRLGFIALALAALLVHPCAAASVHNPVWSGVVLDAPVPNALGITPRLVKIHAKWTVPNATFRPGLCVGFQPVEQWIGLDGFGGNEVLQAGVGTYVDCLNRQVHASAWFGWWPAPFGDATAVPTVAPGDTVEVLVWVDGTGVGHAQIRNLTTAGDSGVMSTARPAGWVAADEVGYTAEWIVEDNADADGGMLNNAPPAQFGTLTMSECEAFDAQGNRYVPGLRGRALATLVSLTDDLSVPSAPGPEVVLFQSAP